MSAAAPADADVRSCPAEHPVSPIAIVILAFSMAADAFAAALARGARHRPAWPQAVRTGLVFGLIETITPLAGWAFGRAAAGYVEAVDHWIAFFLLIGVGGRMIREAFISPDDPDEPPRGGWMTLVATAVGTSIDAAAVGVGLAMIEVNILVVAASIGAATTLMATIGLRIGRMAGEWLGRRVEFVAGLALILLGTAILLEHTGYLG